MVQNAAIRATLACEISNLNPKEIIHQRLRLERGHPATIHRLDSPLTPEHDTFGRLRSMGYAHGIYAYITGDDGRTSITLTNLKTHESIRLTTENREQLTELRVSKLLIAAVSTRGYCHIWDLRTQEHREFRLSSLNFTHFLIHGHKVVIGYRAYLIHWGWDSGIARTIPVKTRAVLVALHPTEDQFTILRVGEEVYYGSSTVIAGKNCQMYAEQYVLDDSNQFHCQESQDQRFPFVDSEELYDAHEAQEIYEGQSSTLISKKGNELHGHRMSLYFSLEGNQVITHTLPPLLPITNVVCMGPNVTYAAIKDVDIMMIFNTTYKKPPNPSSKIMRECHHAVLGDTPAYKCCWLFGDSEFLVMANLQQVEIWRFSNPH
ncbi:uncharacterized protein N7483_005582 [Penicillium malachiteum]|uniref:uncharacterized protein n=1 Tax=Penicillium malachiteum TaxID=1324776 RepID=UPI0025473ACA|nr:uncharacterized protein N7483_005582 [Penicillium malachiteum]KAJ5731074.1 hypothetical protein N7483_005582 [Penicillium malachiteum]